MIAEKVSAILLKQDIQAHVVIDRKGCRITTQKSTCLQCHVYLKADIFSSFFCESKQQFGINLSLLLDCLNVFGNNSQDVSLQIRFAGEGRPLLLEMSDGDMVSSSGISTAESEDPIDFCFTDNPVVNKLIIQATALKEALAELAWWGDSLKIHMSPNSPHLRMSSKGPNGSCEIDFPSSCEVLDEFNCPEDTTDSFRFSLLDRVQKALGCAISACLRVNQRGMLSIQLAIKDDSHITTCVEFLVCPDAEQEERKEE